MTKKALTSETIHETATRMNMPALPAAATLSNHGTVYALIEDGADPNAKTGSGDTALHIAAQNGEIALVRALLKAGADPTLKNDALYTPIRLARLHGHDSLVATLEQGEKDFAARNLSKLFDRVASLEAKVEKLEAAQKKPGKPKTVKR